MRGAILRWATSPVAAAVAVVGVAAAVADEHAPIYPANQRLQQEV
jgi:hypothetical protein